MGKHLGPGDFSYSELKRAVDFYSESIATNPSKSVTVNDFMTEFRCPTIKASVLRSAALFHYKLKCKGMA